MKAIDKFVDNAITYLGKSNDSEVVTAILAASKLLFIPIATLSDKKTSKEQKEYALKRDFVTETAALLGYVGITKAVKNTVTAPVCAKYYKNAANKLVKENKLDKNSLDYKTLANVDKTALKNHAMSDISTNVKALSESQKENISNLKGVVKKFSSVLQDPKELYLNTKKTISHVCVCTLALSLIPFATNKLLEMSANSKNKKADLAPNPPKKPLKSVAYQPKSGYGGLNVFSR